MSKELVISANRHETRVALTEDDQLVEVYFQRSNEYSLAGSIHKGRVTRVLPGMQSAFVNIGLERDAFLYVSDFLLEEEDDTDGLEQVVSRSRPVITEPHGVGEDRGWPVTIGHDLDAALPGTDAVMMLRVQAERMRGQFFPSAREYSINYGLTEARLALLPEHAVVLHPGPMLRGMEIAHSVADSPRAAITEQVRNGVHVRMAVLYHLLAAQEDQA